MFLNRTIASEIISELQPIIDFDLNIIDTSGKIWASTDPGRIDTHHDGARKLIEQGLSELIIYDDHTYEGCRKGINLPICFANEIEGVIGITGEPAEARSYGRIVQKMTEMILYEKYIQSERDQQNQEKVLFVNDLIHGNLNNSLTNIENLLLKMGLNRRGPFTVAIIKLNAERMFPSVTDNPTLSSARESVIKSFIINELFKKRILAVQNAEYYICVSNLAPPRYAEVLQDLGQSLSQRYSMTLFAAVGNEYADYLDIPKSYNEAINIIYFFQSKKNGVYLFNEVELDFIVNQIPTIHKNNLYRKIFQNCGKEEINDYQDFITSYFECNGSLKKLSELYYIHINSVQYKIHQITKKTGRDLRKYHDLFILYLAATQNRKEDL